MDASTPEQGSQPSAQGPAWAGVALLGALMCAFGTAAFFLREESPCGRHDLEVQADFDGDGRVDEAYVDRGPPGGSRIGVCSSRGPVQGLEDVADVEGLFNAVDLQGDGRAELIYGGTTVSQTVSRVAAVTDGRLVSVSANGEALHVTAGAVPLEVDDAGNASGGIADTWGCVREGGQPARLILVEARWSGLDADVVRRVFRVDGVVAHLVATRTAQMRLSERDLREPYSIPDQRLRAGLHRCGVVPSR